MQFYKTVDGDGYIRIEEDSGAAITLYLQDDVAYIIALFVPKSDRRDGIGSGLLSAAEQEAFLHNARLIEADFLDRIEGMQELFEEAGYELSRSGPIVTMDTGKLLEAKTVKTSLKKTVPDVKFVSFGDFSMDQWDTFLDVLHMRSVKLGTRELSSFSQSLSGVVFDEGGDAKAFILCNEKDGGLHIAFLGTAKEEDKNSIMPAVQGMLMELIVSGGVRSFPVITAFCANESIIKLLDKVLPEKAERTGWGIYVKKELSKEVLDDTDIEIEEDLDEDMFDEWRRELIKVPLQANIEWKASWQRDRMDKRNLGKNPESDVSEEHTADEEDKESVNTTKEDAEQDDEEDDKEFPYELADALTIDYGFDKGESITDGLSGEKMQRITRDNLDEVRDYLPVDAVQDLPRPCHRGLIELSGKKPPYLVYELKHMDDMAERYSRICWLGLSKNTGKLFDEYTAEVKRVGVLRSTIETEVTDKMREALIKAGFTVEERESEDLIVTIGDLGRLPFVSKNVPEYVCCIKDIGERQFKRGVASCLVHNKNGLLEDLALLPMDWFDQELSSAVLIEDKVVGLLFVHQLPSRRLMVDLIFSAGEGDRAETDILMMITRSIQAAVLKYPKATQVILRRHNQRIRAITDRFFPGKKGSTVLYGERKED